MQMRRGFLTTALIAMAVSAVVARVGFADLTAETKKATIDEIVKAMNEGYIFPDKAKEAEKALRAYEKEGKYASVTEGQAFAALLTQQLREICKDAHLGVRYSADPLPERKERREPSADEIAKQKS